MRSSTKYVNATMGLALAFSLELGCGDSTRDTDLSVDSGLRADGGKHAEGGAGAVDSGARADAGAHADSGTHDAGLDGASPMLSDASTRLSEGQIVGVISAANAGSITTGLFAQTQGSSPAVRDFGATMVMKHTAAELRHSALGIPSEPSDASTTLSTMTQTAVDSLLAAGAAFDLMYLESQVAAQTNVLHLIDEVLFPGASTPALKSELSTTRSEAAMQLAKAQELVAAARNGSLPAAAPDAGKDGGADAGP